MNGTFGISSTGVENLKFHQLLRTQLMPKSDIQLPLSTPFQRSTLLSILGDSVPSTQSSASFHVGFLDFINPQPSLFLFIHVIETTHHETSTTVGVEHSFSSAFNCKMSSSSTIEVKTEHSLLAMYVNVMRMLWKVSFVWICRLVLLPYSLADALTRPA